MADKPNKNEGQLFSQLLRYCAFQERCVSEVREKLLSLEVPSDEAESLIERLVEIDTLSDERYTRAVVFGKFHQKKWGKMKIRQSLRTKRIDSELIDMVVEEIDPEAYLDQLVLLARQKDRSVRAKSIYERRHKISKFLIGKGYEADVVWKVLRTEFPDSN